MNSSIIEEWILFPVIFDSMYSEVGDEGMLWNSASKDTKIACERSSKLHYKKKGEFFSAKSFVVTENKFPPSW